MAGFKSIIAHMNKEQLEAAVIRALAITAGPTHTTINVVEGGHFTKRDVARVNSVLNRLSRRKRIPAPVSRLAHILVGRAKELDENKAHRGFGCETLMRAAAKRLVQRG